VLIEMKTQQGLLLAGGLNDDITAPAAVAAVRTAPGYIFLAPETDTTGPSVAGGDLYFSGIYKFQGKLPLSSRAGKGQKTPLQPPLNGRLYHSRPENGKRGYFYRYEGLKILENSRSPGARLAPAHLFFGPFAALKTGLTRLFRDYFRR
jgi:hypothetical protein